MTTPTASTSIRSVQQLLAYNDVPSFGLPAYAALSMAISVAAGALSWFLIEKPVIRIGRRIGEWQPWRAKCDTNLREQSSVATN